MLLLTTKVNPRSDYAAHLRRVWPRMPQLPHRGFCPGFLPLFLVPLSDILTNPMVLLVFFLWTWNGVI